MKKRVGLIFFALIFVLTSSVGCTGNAEENANGPLEMFYSAVSNEYPIEVMEAVSAFGMAENAGFRMSGSAAELAAAEYIYNEMLKLGLENVVKDKLAVDSWEFTKAELSFVGVRGESQSIDMMSHAAQYVCDAEALNLVYAGRGTDADYENTDVSDKLVLIDADSAAEDWISWTVYQAKLKGAKAVVVAYESEDESYLSEIHDICGLSDAPAFAISARDGDVLKKLIAASEGNEISVTLTADSRVSKDGTAYSVIGEIPGTTEEVVYMTAHYDGYFGVVDNGAAGVGVALGIAKALLDGGYEPLKTIRFVFHPANEWGLSDSRYDWATGAHRTVRKHPEWKDNAFALISLDGGVGNDLSEGIEASASWELWGFADRVGSEVEENPFEYLEIVPPATPLTEGFVYARNGIPVLGSGFSDSDGKEGESEVFGAGSEKFSYSEEAVLFAQKLYGTYLIELDRLILKPLDYIEPLSALLDAVDPDASPNTEAFEDAVYDALDAVDALNAKIESYDFSTEEAKEFNAEFGRLSNSIHDKLMSLNRNDEVIFAHERYQHNAAMLSSAISALKDAKDDDGGVGAALGYLSEVDLNGYAPYFDRETYDYFAAQVLGDDAPDSWGSGYITDLADIYDVMRVLKTAADASVSTADGPGNSLSLPGGTTDSAIDAATDAALEVSTGTSVSTRTEGYVSDFSELLAVTGRGAESEAPSDGVLAEGSGTAVELLEIELLNQQRLLREVIGRMTKDIITMTQTIERLAEV